MKWIGFDIFFCSSGSRRVLIFGQVCCRIYDFWILFTPRDTETLEGTSLFDYDSTSDTYFMNIKTKSHQTTPCIFSSETLPIMFQKYKTFVKTSSNLTCHKVLRHSKYQNWCLKYMKIWSSGLQKVVEVDQIFVFFQFIYKNINLNL